MRRGLLLAGLLTALTATAAVAAEGPYLGASAGVAFYQDNAALYQASGHAGDSFDPGFAIKLAGGYLFDNNLRLEGELGYRRATISAPASSGGSNGGGDDTRLVVYSAMFNCYYDVNTSLPVAPFLSAGIGALQGRFQTYTVAESADVTFGYQASAGVSYSVTKTLNLDLAYRFESAIRDFRFDTVSFPYRSNNILAGIRYTFL